MLHLHNDSSQVWLDHGVQSGDQGHEAERAPRPGEGTGPEPHAGALLLEAPCDPSPTANFHLYAGLGCRPQTGQGSTPLGPGRHWLVDPFGPDYSWAQQVADLPRVCLHRRCQEPRMEVGRAAVPPDSPSWETSLPAARCPSSLLQKLQIFCDRRPGLYEGLSSQTPYG